ncbi:MAG: hypothetical protein OEY28_12650, partial [Nitrospira sp.]|nr:hypothetical protein [Nitrospira sp.]
LDARFRGHDLRFTVTACSPHLARGSGHSLVIAPFNCGIRDYRLKAFGKQPLRTSLSHSRQSGRT